MKFDLKTFVTVCMTISLIVFTYLKIIEPDTYKTICVAIFTYYFAHKKLEGGVENDNKQENIESEQDTAYEQE